MDSQEFDVADAVPLQLQLRVLRTELERLEEDLTRLSERRARVLADIGHYEELLDGTRRRALLRRVK